MARTRKRTGTHTRIPGKASQMRGGVPGTCVDSGFGSKSNLNRSKKVYKTRRELEK